MDSSKRAIGLSARAAAIILLLGGPPILIHCCDYLQQVSVANQHHWVRDTQFYEIFAGTSRLTSTFRQHGFASHWYDFEGRPDNDFTSTTGFLIAIRDVMRVQPGGYVHGGHPCSGFIWISTGSHCRHLSILGSKISPLAMKSNCLLARFSLLILLCIALQIHWTVEQPSSSRLVMMPYIQHISSAMELWAKQYASRDDLINFKRFWMGLYGSPTPKASYLLGSPQWIQQLSGTLTPEKKLELSKSNESGMVKKSQDSITGATKVCGGPSLKGSAAYPQDFCDFVVREQTNLWAAGELPYLDLPKTADELKSMQPLVPPFDWAHAELDAIRDFLVSEANEGRFKPAAGIPL